MARSSGRRLPTSERTDAMTRVWGAVLVAIFALCVSAAQGQKAQKHPNLSGYWSAGRAFRATEAPPGPLPPNTVLLADAGAPELPSGNFGGLKVKPAALAAAMKWKPQDE